MLASRFHHLTAGAGYPTGRAVPRWSGPVHTERVAEPITIEIAEDGADAERIDALTGYLRQDLLQLDVAEVRRAAAGPPPPGTRGIDVAAVGALLVSLGGAATSINEIVTVVRGWLSRGSGVKRTVKLTIDGDVLELSEASLAEQDRLVDLFVRRHSGG